MKASLFILGFLSFIHLGKSQIDSSSLSISDSSNIPQLYKILKTDGGELVGEIINQDSRDVFFKISSRG